MITTGSKFLIGSAVLAIISAIAYGVTQDGVMGTIGLASAIRGRNPMVDGFGLIAFASLTPMIFVMGYGMLF